MKYYFLTFFLFVTISLQSQRVLVDNWELENIPDIPTTVEARQQQYNQVRSARLLGWLPQRQGMLISTRFSQHYQLHTVARPEGARQQITFFEQGGINNALFRPQHNGFLFRMDPSAGGENYQLYYYDLTERRTQMLSDGEANHTNAIWSPDGRYLAYSSNKKQTSRYELFILDLTSRKEVYLPQAADAWYPLDWHPDGTLLVGRYLIPEYALYQLEWPTNELKPILIDEKEACIFNQLQLGADPDILYFTSDGATGQMDLYRYNRAQRQLMNLTETLPQEIDNIWLSPDRTQLFFSTHENGNNPVYRLDPKALTFQKLNNFPEGLIYNLHVAPDNERIGFVLNNSLHPGDIYEYELSSQKLQRWTRSEVGGLDTDQFAKGTFFTYPTFDSINGDVRQIPAFIYKPNRATGPLPVLINIHGGPQFQHLPYFRPSVQILTNELGIAVVGPNVRGSSGYGADYLNLDNGFKREDAVRDIGKLLDWIETQPDLDASKVAVYGGSYGGYMAMASLTHYNDRLACGISLVGAMNWVTFLENVRESGRERRRAEYGDERDPEVRAFLDNISPLNNVHKITKPVLLAQGANDPRMTLAQSEQMLAALQANGVETWYMLAKDEGHNFRSRDNIDFFRQVLYLFLEKHLLKSVAN